LPISRQLSVGYSNQKIPKYNKKITADFDEKYFKKNAQM
jgi:hypothetical protein